MRRRGWMEPALSWNTTGFVFSGCGGGGGNGLLANDPCCDPVHPMAENNVAAPCGRKGAHLGRKDTSVSWSFCLGGVVCSLCVCVRALPALDKPCRLYLKVSHFQQLKGRQNIDIRVLFAFLLFMLLVAFVVLVAVCECNQCPSRSDSQCLKSWCKELIMRAKLYLAVPESKTLPAGQKRLH